MGRRARRRGNTRTQEARVYIDPTTGSLMLQVLAAGVLAVAAGVRSARESAMRLLRGLFGRRRER